MRIPSGVTDQYIYFVAVDSADLQTRETGLTSFTVYRSRNGSLDTLMTTPTTVEIGSSTSPGVYGLLLDEDMTITSGNDSEECCVHITKAGMASVTRTYELYRPKITAGNAITVDSSGHAEANIVEISDDATAATNMEAFFDGTGYAGTGNTIPTVTNVTNEVTADMTKISGDTTAANNAESFFDGTGYAGTNNVIPSVTTVTGNVNGSVGSVTGAVGSVTGAVGSVTGSVGSVTAEVSADVTKISGDTTAANNAELFFDGTGYNASNSTIGTATSVGTVTGNVNGSVGSVTGTVGSVTGAVGSVTGAVGSVTATVNANMIQISSDTTAANNAEAFFDGTGYNSANSTIGTVTDVTNAVSVSGTVSANMTQISGDTTAANNAEAFFDNTGFNASASTIGTCTTNTDMVSEPLSAAQVNAEVDTALGDYDGPTKAEMDSGFAALNDVSTAQVNAEVDNAIVTYGLDHLVQTSVTGTDVANNSIIARLVSDSATADWDSFVNTTDSLEALSVKLNGTVNANMIQISSDTTAANNCEAFFDGTGYAGTGNTIPTVTNVGTVTGNVNGSVGSVTGAVGSVTGAVGSVTGAVGSVTAQVSADVTAISGDTVAANNAESFFDGTGYAGTGNTIPTVTSVGTVTGNVDGSVGSVTGAVGSVTGAVGSVTAEVSANMTKISGDTIAANNCEAFFDGTGYAGTGNVIPSVTTVTGNVNGSVGSVTGAVGSVTGAVGSVTAEVSANVTKISGDTTAANNAELFFDGTGYNAANSTVGTVTDVTNAVSVTGTVSANVVQISSDTTAANNAEAFFDNTGFNASNSTIGTVTTNTDMRGTDNAALATVCTEGRLAELDAANLPADVDAILLDTGTTLDGKINTIDGNVDSIKAKTDDLTFTVANQVDVNVLSVDGSADAAATASDFYEHGIITGTVSDGSPGVGGFDTSLTLADDYINKMYLVFVSGARVGHRPIKIADYVNTNGAVTLDVDMEAAPANGDKFMVLGIGS